jgi:hypothetical protein
MGVLHDDGMSQHETLRRLFESIDYSKAIPPRYEQPGDDDDPRVEDDDNKLSAKLDEIVAEMIVARPSLHPHRARRWLLQTPQGQAMLAQHTTMKKESPMLDIAKLIPITEDALMAQVTKRDGESYAKSFSRRYETDIDFRKQWAALTEAKHLMALSKSMAHMTPTSTEVGNTNVADDSAEAVRLLREMAEKQRRTFEQVFSESCEQGVGG